MSWHYLRELAGESLEDICSDGEQLQPLKLQTTHAVFYCNGKLMDSYLDSLYGMTFAPLMENPGEQKSMSSQVDSHAKTFQSAEKVMDLKEKGPDCGERWQGLLAKFDPITSLWKTPQCSLLEDLEQSLETWSNWGSMLNGACWEETTPNYLIEENEFGCWLPTMTVSMKNGCSSKRYLNSKEYRGSMPMEWIRTSKDCAQYFHPDYAELLMDFPIKWTDLKPLEMDKFQSWRQQHGESSQKDN